MTSEEATVAVQSQNIEWPYVYAWCDRHGTRAPSSTKSVAPSLPCSSAISRDDR